MQQSLTDMLEELSLMPVVQAAMADERKGISMAGGRCSVNNSACAGELVWNDELKLPLCWHHDNEADSAPVRISAKAWGRRWLLRELAEMDADACRLLMWMLMKGLGDQITPGLISMATKVTNAPVSVAKGFRGRSDTDARYREGRLDALVRQIGEQKELLALEVDPETPNALMAIPKYFTWENDKYRRWVKTLPCVVCDRPADDPHHIIDHGQLSMGGKAHDLFTIPLCRQHHNELHHDRAIWERQHGSQVGHVLATINNAMALGVIG